MADFREPTTSLPLRWGFYRTRYLGGLLLIVSGTLGLQAANPHILHFLLLGTAANAVGWSVLPASGWRRLAVAVPSAGAIWFLLTGPQSVGVLTVSLACWLLARHRPLRSYLVLIFPLMIGMLLPQLEWASVLPTLQREYSAMPIALVVMALVLVLSAWIARLIAQSAPVPSEFPAAIR